jgi:hypothetical protein
LNLTLPPDNSFVPFSISGQTASAASGDAQIVARLNTAAGPVITNKSVSVFTFTPANIVLQQGGDYALVGNLFSAAGAAVSFSSQAQLSPAGLNCAAPQIAPLRAAIMQEGSNFVLQATYGPPSVVWLPTTPSGTMITIPTTKFFTISINPTVTQPVNDGLAGASPLYSKAPAAVTPLIGCAGGIAATSSDNPNMTSQPNITQSFSNAGTPVAVVTWPRQKVTAQGNFRTFCVVFNNSTSVFCSLREALWTLNVDNTAGQHANVALDSPASANPATGPQLNNSFVMSTTDGPGTTTVTNP